MGVGNKRTLRKTRRKTRDIDQIKADLLSSKHLAAYLDREATEDLPGMGSNYCIECAKWYDTESNLIAHKRGKPHKRRLRQLREEPEAKPRRIPIANLAVQADAQAVSEADAGHALTELAM